MPSRSSRIRVDQDEVELLYNLLYSERGRLIDEKIAVRDIDGQDTTKIRKELAILRRMMDEVQRARNEIEQ